MDDNAVLLLIDVQCGFDDPYWGRRDNPEAEGNIARLIDGWARHGRPVVVVRHDSIEPGSPLERGTPANRFKPELAGVAPELMFTKAVNSAFHGEVDLDGWLRGRGVGEIVLAGIQTNMCVETTARVGGNLGYRVRIALDATFTFDATGPDGVVLTAEQLSAATATTLHAGGFARIDRTADLLAELG